MLAAAVRFVMCVKWCATHHSRKRHELPSRFAATQITNLRRDHRGGTQNLNAATNEKARDLRDG